LHEECNNCEKKKYLVGRLTSTDDGEISVLLGIILVMSYNKLPKISDYWSQNVSMGNEAVRNAMNRFHFQLIESKLYFAEPNKPDDASKTYYLDELVACLKIRFRNLRAESVFQSIDKSMTKFTGRSSLKQYMPLKPIKRGIKMWMRSDSRSGYVYDFNIYRGQEEDEHDDAAGTLGERVVLKLTETIKSPDVSLTFDRFFTSIHLLDTIAYSSVGTLMSNCKNAPKFDSKLKKSEYELLHYDQGTLVARSHNSKEFMLSSNCNCGVISEAAQKQETGEKLICPCPQAIEFYNSIMGGVDLTDQKTGLYDLDRKSHKWWKKVFFKLFMTSVVNACL